VKKRRGWISVLGAAVITVTVCPVWAAPQTSTTKPSTPQKTTPRPAATKPPAARPATTTAKSTAAPAPATRQRQSLALARARAAAAARARAAAADRTVREAQTARFKRDLLGNLIPDVRAAAAVIYDPQTGTVLYDENAHDQRSIASLTKLMTAVTFVADAPDLTQRVAVTRADMKGASTTYIRAGELISYNDLLHLLLIASDNAAARVLARTSEGGTDAFVVRMNAMATELGLTSTHYTDPSGLDANNVSSAFDLSHLIAFAGADPVLGPVLRTGEYQAQTSQRAITVHSTNKLLGTGIDVLGAKTGFISKAGYCLATLLRVPEGPSVAVVVLGAANSTTRFWEARHLFNWVVGRTQGIVGGEDQEK
jgi:D-alanyl-D-alanine endopeptidase (penicillin-binding protein 7)